ETGRVVSRDVSQTTHTRWRVCDLRSDDRELGIRYLAPYASERAQQHRAALSLEALADEQNARRGVVARRNIPDTRQITRCAHRHDLVRRNAVVAHERVREPTTHRQDQIEPGVELPLVIKRRLDVTATDTRIAVRAREQGREIAVMIRHHGLVLAPGHVVPGADLEDDLIAAVVERA